MRNTIVENPTGVFVLYRDGEKCHGGDSLALPSELEFWQEIERLRDKLVECGVCIGDLEAKAERLQGMVQSRGDEIELLREAVKDHETRRLSLELLHRKLAHGCIDAPCHECER
jgi:hypothetical protein